jgi:hypothetical protein
MIEFRAFPVECCGNRTNKLLVVVAVRGARLPFVLDLAVPPLVYAKIPNPTRRFVPTVFNAVVLGLLTCGFAVMVIDQ